MKILFLATYFPRPLNPTIGTWALEQAKAFHDSPELEVKVVSANPWFPKWSGRLKKGVRAYSDCPRSHDWGGVQVEYVPMLYYPFGKLDAVFNRVGEPLLLLGWLSLRPRLMNIVREFDPDVVYAHHTVPNGYFALRLWQETGIPFVVTDHEMGEITACEEFPARKAVYNKVTSAAFRMVAVAKVMQRDMERVLPQARCETIHNGVGNVLGGEWRVKGDEAGDERTKGQSDEGVKGPRDSRSGSETDWSATTAAKRNRREARSTLGTTLRSRGEEVKSVGLRVTRAAEECSGLESRSAGGSVEAAESPQGRVKRGQGPEVGDQRAEFSEPVVRWAGVSEGGFQRPEVGAAGRVVVFSCGMFYGRKNFPGLIQAFNLVAEKYQHVVLRIAGDGPDRREVEAEWKRSPFKDRIELMGKIGHEEVLQEMRDADIFALIGWREPFATVFLEAMAADLPVIACDDGGIAEVINSADTADEATVAVVAPGARPNGLLVPPKDIPAAARALEFLIVNPDLRKEIGAAAQRKLQAELTWEAISKKYIQIFREAAGATGSRGLKDDAAELRCFGKPVVR